MCQSVIGKINEKPAVGYFLAVKAEIVFRARKDLPASGEGMIEYLLKDTAADKRRQAGFRLNADHRFFFSRKAEYCVQKFRAPVGNYWKGFKQTGTLVITGIINLPEHMDRVRILEIHSRAVIAAAEKGGVCCQEHIRKEIKIIKMRVYLIIKIARVIFQFRDHIEREYFVQTGKVIQFVF